MSLSEEAEHSIRIQLITGIVLSGILLLALLPIGIYAGVDSSLFSIFFLSHLGLVLLSTYRIFTLMWSLGIDSSWRRTVFFFLAVLFLCAMVIQGILPVTAQDALIHHLAVPKWWVEANRIIPIAWHEWSFYPMLLNLGFTFLLKNGLGVLIPLYHTLFLILLCGVVSSFVYYKSRKAHLTQIAFLLTLSLPICIRLASTPLVDLGLALWAAIAWFSIIYWIEEEKGRRYLFLSGISLGLALGTKYNGLLYCALFFPFYLLLCLQRRLSVRVIFWGGATLIFFALLVYSPWLIKNFSWTGNPIYPLYKNTFGGSIDALPATSGFGPLEHRKRVYGESDVDIILIPIRMLLFGKDGDPRYFDGVLSPFLVLAILPVWLLRRESWAVSTSLISAFYVLFAVVLGSSRIRYIAPVYGPLLVLAVFGLNEAGRLFKQSRVKPFQYIVFSFHLIFALVYIALLFKTSETIHFISGSETKQDYLRRRIEEYKVIEFANQNIKEGATYLLLTGNVFYYFEGQVISGGYYSADPVIQWINNASDSKGLKIAFESHQISYLLAHVGRTKRSLSGKLSNAKKSLWNDFVTQELELIKREDPYWLWRLRK